MCGIVGCIGTNNAAEALIDSLERLEYRGYDSAGVALVSSGELNVIKSKGRIFRLKDKMSSKIFSRTGIGHTRWATHGSPSDINAHPHTDCTGKIAVVHNGIIENYQELKNMLISRGHRFVSETDTEVLAHLIEEHYVGDTKLALREAISEVEGSYAIAVVNRDEPDKIFAARKDSPMVIGLGENNYYLASDVTAFVKHTRNAIFLHDGDMAVLTNNGVSITDFLDNPVMREVTLVEWDIEAAEKCGYDHFMLKEIHEQPKSLKDVMSGRLNEFTGDVELKEMTLTRAEIGSLKRVIIIACGTSYHAGMMGKYAIESVTDIPVSVEIGSEFRYSSNRVGPETLIIAISQSGETADTVAAIKDARKKGSNVIAITNVVGSTISREADSTIYMRTGPEIGVAATKTFTGQIAVIYMIALYLGRARGNISPEDARSIISEMKSLSQKSKLVLEKEEYIANIARMFVNAPSFFFVGRNLNFPAALEGALKLKEISYIYSEGFAAGELKHGPLALLTTNIPVVAIATRCPTYDKMVSNIKEIKARDASVIAIASECDNKISQFVDLVIKIPDAGEYASPVLSSIALQLFAYYVARFRGCPIDKPRNLAKSVTVE
ncbi:glutamine--fructose-6-phosphate transaminase (isomerizing) [Methanocella sp. CWC-04]|uniref:Glutamine--fructose-6-phosphate aminotransferase [isomerizing] n=1 Tax=Methanooceanicella nereidis TaxID=2052831 RepID=A0AAP2RD50_9EURY|nr:glutamine--fructose-6-phosphate transaminase (isomerizing) [Methanocella sp. CWC-04]